MRRGLAPLTLALCGLIAAAAPASAQTLTNSLQAAYSNNPSLNQARSNLRSIDESIAIARSGNRPNLSATFSQFYDTVRQIGGVGAASNTGSSRGSPTIIQLDLTQPLFQGFQVRNSIRQAEVAVLAGRASLENTEQDVLLNTITAFFDVIEDRQVVDLRRNDVSFLAEQVRAAQDRFEVGEGTRTDVSQAEARRAQSQSLLNTAEANLAADEASYFQQTGLQARGLTDNIDVEKILPKTVEDAITLGQSIHPAIIATLYDVDTAMFNVKILEGQLLPTVALSGQVRSNFNPSVNSDQIDDATVGVTVTIPIYQGGEVSAEVRQAKQDLGTSRISVDITRDSVRQNTVASYAAYVGAIRSIQTSRTEVFAAQLALQGVIEEQRVGQRTTLDVLDAQRDVITAQLTLVGNERDARVAAYSLLSAVGQLTAKRLGLGVEYYVPEEYTNTIRDRWFGLRTPDGR